MPARARNPFTVFWFALVMIASFPVPAQPVRLDQDGLAEGMTLMTLPPCVTTFDGESHSGKGDVVKSLSSVSPSAEGPPPAPTWVEIQAALLSLEAPITDRYRALFFARQTAPSPELASRLMIDALAVQSKSMLLRHEICYVMGQVGEQSVVPRLLEVLRDESEDEVVRHEAVEALAALQENDIVDELEALNVATDVESLRHTGELAVAALRKRMTKSTQEEKQAIPICVCQFTSHDPAEGLIGATDADVPRAADLLVDPTLPLFERYEGMFTLRNVGGVAATTALAAALRQDTSSAVLRHEVAFVLGQMEDELAASALIESLGDISEHAMVRHEAAIALGAIGSEVTDAALRAFLCDSDQMVAESCEVALATAAYWRAWEEIEKRCAAS